MALLMYTKDTYLRTVITIAFCHLFEHFSYLASWNLYSKLEFGGDDSDTFTMRKADGYPKRVYTDGFNIAGNIQSAFRSKDGKLVIISNVRISNLDYHLFICFLI